MSYVDTPHFNIPFRLRATGAETVEQDSIDDVANCVVVIVSTPIGWRDDNSDFGFNDLAMRRQPIGTEEIAAQISDQDPRALLIVEESPDMRDELIDRIEIGVSTMKPKT